MGMLKFEDPHGLPKDEARKRIEQLVKYWIGKYGVAAQWSGDSAHISGKVMGIKLDAKLAVSDRNVGGEATDPGMLLRGKARSYLEHKFVSYLDSKKSLEDLQRGEA